MLKNGIKVHRLEMREQVLATVIETNESGVVLIEYEEGGQGWWPIECLTVAVADEDDEEQP